MNEFILKLMKRYKDHREKDLFPEREYVVEVNDVLISCKRTDGTVEQVSWEELCKFEIHTNSLGPFVEDVFFVLHGKNRGCCIPQGGTNTSELLEHLIKLPGFNSDVFSEAMACTSDNVFLVWEKQSE